MSDIDNSYGRPAPGSSWEGIRTNLAEMERRLSELQDQLDPQRAAGGVRSMVGVGLAGTGQGMTPFAHAGTLPGAVATGFVPPPFGADPAARQSAEEILDQARAAAREVLAAAEAQVGIVKEQIEQLLQARETLRGSLRAALTDCESVLGRLERGEHPRGGASGERLAVERPTTPHRLGIGAPMLDPLSATALSTTGALARGSETPDVFEGTVSLRIGPLRDISQVDTLEIALLQVPGAEQVEIKEFAGRDAVAAIKLFQPVPLVEELRRVLPFQFEVAGGDAADALTLIAIEYGETAEVPDDAADAFGPVGVE
jgi:hypothetical protein